MAKATRKDELKDLSTEWNFPPSPGKLNLPITGSCARMLERLRLATNSTPAAIQRRPRGRPHNGQLYKPSGVRPRLQPKVLRGDSQFQRKTGSRTSTQQSKSCSRTTSHAAFSPAQMLAIQETVSSSDIEALRVFSNHEAQTRFPDELRTLSPRVLNTAAPLGLHRPGKKPRGQIHLALVCY